MTVTSARLVKMTVKALRLARTDAGDKVYTPGDWSTRLTDFPLILVQAVHEDKQSSGRGPPSFTVVTTIRITGRVSAMGQPSDQGGEHAENMLWRLQRQIERAVINADVFVDPDTNTPFIQQFPSIRTTLGATAEGAQQVGEIVIDLAIEYFQGPDDFYGTPEVEIAGFDLQDQRPALGLTSTA